jgi:putative ABC transport system permease protein
MSGGQMQRVAIARALVNNPDILLADEPTGALDTQTSVQIMDLLKEVASDRLVIMVTHNPELAEQYSTRIVRLSDGVVIDDSNPLSAEEYTAAKAKDEAALIALNKDKKAKKAMEKKTSMSFATAISLSFKNLLTKKGRTILTSFAGSIGIIGIALVLSLSNGIQLFIDQVQEDTLSTYPLTILKETQDMTAMMEVMMTTQDAKDPIDPDKIYVDDSMDKMVSAMNSMVSNDLASFKEYIEAHPEIKDKTSDIQYTYDLDLQVYNTNTKPSGTKDGEKYESVPTKLGLSNLLSNMGQFSSMSSLVENSGMGNMAGLGVMSEMIDNQDLLNQQYDLAAGHWPEESNELVLVIGKNNQISKLMLYMLGILDQSELDDAMTDIMNKDYHSEEIPPFAMKDFLGMEFYMLTKSDFYQKTDKTCPTDPGIKLWEEKLFSSDKELKAFVEENGIKLKISGIVRPRVDATASSITGALGYTKALTNLVLEKNAKSDILNEQKKNPSINITTGLPHELENKKYTVDNIDELFAAFDANTMSQISAIMSKSLVEDFKTSPLTSEDEKIQTKAQKFLAYSTLLNSENKIALALSMFDAAVEANPMAPNMIFGAFAMNQALQGLMTIDSREDLEFCLPSLAANDVQYATLIGILSNFNKDNMDGFYTQFETMLGSISLSREFCVTFIKSLADAEEADQQASEIGMTVDEIIEEYNAVTREQLRKLAGEMFDWNKASMSAVGKVKTIADYSKWLGR